MEEETKFEHLIRSLPLEEPSDAIVISVLDRIHRDQKNRRLLNLFIIPAIIIAAGIFFIWLL